LDGFGSIPKYVAAAKDMGFTHLACTDHANIDGLIRFQKECDKNKIIPVSGCEAYIVPSLAASAKGEKRGHVTLLIKNQQGFENLCQMLTIANLKGFYYRPRIDFDLLYDHCEGLVILTGCASTFLTLPGGPELYYDIQSKIKDDLYLEVMPHILFSQVDVNRICCAEMKGRLVATNDCHYIAANDAKAQEVLLAVQTKALWTDKDRYRFPIQGLHLRSANEMINQFKAQECMNDDEVGEAMDSAMEIAEKCGGFRIPKQDIYLPVVPKYKDLDPEKFLWDICWKALADKFGGESRLELDSPAFQIYTARMNEEWRVIKEKKFIPYFMIVYELIEWCRENDIMVGPGRGSVGGCLIAYLLGITMVNPLKYDLLFSRFISEDRNDLPDIDLDFEDRKRPLVREHLEALYGKDNISSISTFLTMKGRGTIRDVARVFDVPLHDVDEFAKTIEDGPDAGEGASDLQSAGKSHWFGQKYPEVLDLAIKLEGQIRGAGQHAAAIIVSADDLTKGTRGNLVMRTGHAVSNWDMQDSEHVGLMKLDILGLNTLSILNEARRLINENKQRLFLYHPESDCYFVGDELDLAGGQVDHIDFDFDRIPLDDQAVYKEIAAGHNVGVFQLSAWATSKLATQIKADRFELLSDVVALVRPGPLDSGMTEDYIKRRNGERWQKKHPIYEEITKDTNGIIIYQEQIMQVFHKVAGMTYSTADKIRKIIGKKRDAREFKPFKDAFVKGCLDNHTLSETEALEFWEALQSHARYSFNKSHSVEYALIGYWTAWCKKYYPTEFLCASLSYGTDGKKEEIIEECYRLGLKLQLPRVGISDAVKWVAKDGTLYVPFVEIKGIGEKLAYECMYVKKKKAVKGIFNIQTQEAAGGKLDKMMAEIGAFGDPPTAPDLSVFFSFRIDQDQRRQYPNLIATLGFSFPESDLDPLLKLDVPRGHIRGAIHERHFENYLGELPDCYVCSLGSQCKGPVMPSRGKYNLMICGEAPGGDEDEAREGFVGRAGRDVLWPELKKHDLFREDFHITNVNKCYPHETKTPDKAEIAACWKWLKQEIDAVQPRLILAFGNTSQKCFVDRDSGIIELSGKTEWSEKASAWICWCVHPAAVLRNSTNKEAFERGINNFSEKIRILGDIQ